MVAKRQFTSSLGLAVVNKVNSRAHAMGWLPGDLILEIEKNLAALRSEIISWRTLLICQQLGMYGKSKGFYKIREMCSCFVDENETEIYQLLEWGHLESLRSQAK